MQQYKCFSKWLYKKPDKKHTIWFHLYKVLENISEIKQVNGYRGGCRIWVEVAGRSGREYERQGNYCIDSIFTNLIAVMVSQTHTCIKIIHFKYVQFILCQMYVKNFFFFFFNQPQNLENLRIHQAWKKERWFLANSLWHSKWKAD